MSLSYIPAEVRRRVTTAAKHRCGYCLTQERIVGTPMQIDHLTPESLGGTTDEENLWLACAACNARKADRLAARDPVSEQLVPLFNPRLQRWSEHHAWVDSGTRVVGLTTTGRATVAALGINRPPLVRARRRWAEAGWHPPED